MLAGLLTDFKDALMSGLSGSSRPAQLQEQGFWIDTTLQGAPSYSWIFKIWTGAEDIEIFRINVLSGYGGSITSESNFDITQISEDTAGAIQELIKNRFNSNGQILSGDTVARIQIQGHTEDGDSQPVTVGYIQWLAQVDQTTGNHGGQLSFFSMPEGSSIIVEHLKFVQDNCEVPVQLLLNAIQPVSQNVATTATILQLSAEKSIVEFTGSTETLIKGINSSGKAKEITLHNRSSANVVCDHDNGDAPEADRFELPLDLSYTIVPDTSATFVRSDVENRWKIKSTIASKGTQKFYELSTHYREWDIPTDVPNRINITTYKRRIGLPEGMSSVGQQSRHYITDDFGTAYAWGYNSIVDPSLGVSNTAHQSSPVAVSGGLRFRSIHTGWSSNFGVTTYGVGYGWGVNTYGQLGDNSAVNKSSPVAILFGLKFVTLISKGTTFGLLEDGTAYSWGFGLNGELGVGSNGINRSVPQTVSGGYRYSQIDIDGTYGTACSVLGVEKDTGKVYMWGIDNLGTVSMTGDQATPTEVPGLTGKKAVKAQVATAGARFLVLTEDGEMYSWGTAFGVRLGNGATSDLSTPVIMPGVSDVIDFISTSTGGHLMTKSGNIYSWGSGQELGNGNPSDVWSTPTVNPTLSALGFEKLYTGTKNASNIWGKTPDGSVYAWGSNDSRGVPGVGIVPTNISSPTAVIGGLKFQDLQISGANALAFGVNGIMYAWGDGTAGAGGWGDSASRSSPVAVLGVVSYNPAWITNTISMEVTPGETVAMRLGFGKNYFKNKPLGNDIEKITIDYSIKG